MKYIFVLALIYFPLIKLQSDYAAAQAVLERISPDIIEAYTQRGDRERKIDQYSEQE